MYEIYNEDCLEGMKRIPDSSVDFILTDLPYGITDCDFDRRIPFESMWEQFWRVTKKNAAIALFANGRFLIELAVSNLRDYRYKWSWVKPQGSGFLNAKKMPLKAHEDILFFYKALPTYNPQFTQGKPYRYAVKSKSPNYQAGGWETGFMSESTDGRRYPLDVLHINGVNNGGAIIGGKGLTVHPQQKPVPLLEYLIRTYTDEGETVLDATMGSGSTGVACVNSGRNFVGFELNEKFFNVAKERLRKATNERLQRLF